MNILRENPGIYILIAFSPLIAIVLTLFSFTLKEFWRVHVRLLGKEAAIRSVVISLAIVCWIVVWFSVFIHLSY